MGDRECALQRAFQYGGKKIAVGIDAFLSHHDKGTAKRRIGRRDRKGLHAAIVA
ncbi:hypothetical protein D3C72_2480420 [compost metagenome]